MGLKLGREFRVKPTGKGSRSLGFYCGDKLLFDLFERNAVLDCDPNDVARLTVTFVVGNCGDGDGVGE